MNEFEAMSEKLNSMGGALWKVIEKERAQNAYLDDPSISERDKELQWALDHDMEVPADVSARYAGEVEGSVDVGTKGFARRRVRAACRHGK